VKSEQLLTQGKIFEDDILAGPECTNNAAEEVPEPYDHAQNLTGTLPIELGAKSLILRVYDVLMNDRPWQLRRFRNTLRTSAETAQTQSCGRKKKLRASSRCTMATIALRNRPSRNCRLRLKPWAKREKPS
jgi:hypothetical protein